MDRLYFDKKYRWPVLEIVVECEIIPAIILEPLIYFCALQQKDQLGVQG